MTKAATALCMLVLFTCAPLGNQAISTLPHWLLFELQARSGQMRTDALDSTNPEAKAAFGKSAFQIDRYLCANGYSQSCSQLYFDAEFSGRYRNQLTLEARELTKALCSAGDYAVCSDFAEFLRQEGREDEALQIFERVCRQSPRHACSVAAFMNLNLGNTAKASDFAVRLCLADAFRCGDFLFDEIDAEAHAFLLKKSEGACLETHQASGGSVCVQVGVYHLRTRKENFGHMVLGLDCMKGNDTACEIGATHLDRQNRRSEAVNIYLKTYCANPSNLMRMPSLGLNCENIGRGRTPASATWKALHARHDQFLGF